MKAFIIFWNIQIFGWKFLGYLLGGFYLLKGGFSECFFYYSLTYIFSKFDSKKSFIEKKTKYLQITIKGRRKLKDTEHEHWTKSLFIKDYQTN